MNNNDFNEFFNDISFEDYHIDKNSIQYKYIIKHIKENIISEFLYETIDDITLLHIKHNIQIYLDNLNFSGEIYEYKIDSTNIDNICTINITLRKNPIELKYINFRTTIMPSNTTDL